MRNTSLQASAESAKSWGGHSRSRARSLWSATRMRPARPSSCPSGKGPTLSKRQEVGQLPTRQFGRRGQSYCRPRPGTPTSSTALDASFAASLARSFTERTRCRRRGPFSGSRKYIRAPPSAAAMMMPVTPGTQFGPPPSVQSPRPKPRFTRRTKGCTESTAWDTPPPISKAVSRFSRQNDCTRRRRSSPRCGSKK
jgi:hypothetical protein